MMGYRFSEQALLDADTLYANSLAQFGHRAAERYFAIMLSAAQFAADHPFASPERAGSLIPLRVRYFGAHLIVYQTVEGGIVVQRIFHQSQDWAEHL
jgi:plasmid stabilization system protein ParE